MKRTLIFAALLAAGCSQKPDWTEKELNINIPTDNAQLNNGAGYIKDIELEEYPASELAAIWKSKFGS